MAYHEKITYTYWDRLIKSVKWTIIWFLFIIGSIFLLWFNEWHFVNQYEWLKEWLWIVKEWRISPIDNTLDWNLVYINWNISVNNEVQDDVFFVSTWAVKLVRKVEILQWKEKSQSFKKDNFWWSQTITTSYTYDKIWDENIINSSNFKEWWHDNPVAVDYENKIFYSEKALIWELELSKEFIEKLDNKVRLKINDTSFNNFRIKNKIKNIKLTDDYIYIFNSENYPDVWDIRISFYAVFPDNISVIWKQNWNTIEPYTTKNHSVISIIKYWDISINEMFNNEFTINNNLTWFLRWLWFVLMLLWFFMFFWIIIYVAKIIPFLSNIISLWIFLASFTLSIMISSLVIAISWFTFRPYFSLFIIIILWLIIYLINLLIKNK